MSDLSLLIIGAGIGLVCSILGGVVGAWVAYRFRLKEEDVRREIVRREEKERARQALLKELSDLSIDPIGWSAFLMWDDAEANEAKEENTTMIEDDD